MKIQTKLRAQDVTRWNIVHTVRKQSLAEHLFNVTILTMELCERLDVSRAGMHMAIDYALHHDIDEILTGDIPSPTKARAREAGVDLNALLQEELPAIDGYMGSIVKAADLLDNLCYIESYGHGRHANEVKLRLHAELIELRRTSTIGEMVWDVYCDISNGSIQI